MNKCLFKLLLILSLIIFPFAVQTSSAAPAYLDFSVEGYQPGSIEYSGGTSPLVGSGISILKLRAFNADGTICKNAAGDLLEFNVVGGTLSFVTGLNTGYDSSSNTWDFSTGGKSYIELYGAIPELGIGYDGQNVTPVLLLSGYGSVGGKVVATPIAGLPFTFNVAILGFFDEKDPTLLEGLGFLADMYGNYPNFVGTMNLSFASGEITPDGFSATTIYSGDIVNTPSVPIPGAFLLLGSGLIGLVGIRRRMLS